MANVTDPLARSVHGTNPQNLIEYITRQKIYDSLYWKEECFGLSASDVATKATELRALGGSYGGNNKPTRFLCLALKLLQIQPEDGIVEEFIDNEDFKYVRALGAFYLRLTGRPAEIYALMEPLYNDFRKLRFREMNGWKITYMDELADELLTCDRYCGIALPHLPKREVLVSAGYIDGPRKSALLPLIEEQAGGDANKFLQQLAEEGNVAAKVVLDDRRKRREEREEKERRTTTAGESESNGSRGQPRYDNERDGGRDRFHGRSLNDVGDDVRYGSGRPQNDNYYGRSGDDRFDKYDEIRHGNRDERSMERKSSKSDDKKYGSLFKQSKYKRGDDSRSKSSIDGGSGNANTTYEGSAEYWNEQRAKLGLKPLKD
jgi:pre-mRNA-splicing factor 38A